MSLWSRVAGVFRRNQLISEIDEELESHVEEAIAQGRDPIEARKSFGSALRRREEIHDIRLLPWLESFRADVTFGWRRLLKNPVTSAAAILSLALAIGSCTSAFRLIDALLLRPLPVADPANLYALMREGIGPDGKSQRFDGWAYPAFRQMRAAVQDQAELLAVSYPLKIGLTYQSDQEIEGAYLQYVSGSMFDSFGIRPALGRVLTEHDDREPGAHPYAVLSHDYWARRFGSDSSAIGRTFRTDGVLFEIVGVADERFTGTDPGTAIDIFVPTMMTAKVTRADQTWIRTFMRLKPGTAAESVRAKLNVTSRAFEADRLKGVTGMTKQSMENFLNQTLVIDAAASGLSKLQGDYRSALIALAVLVGLVLLIACANVANLLTAQAATRAREMALRVSIGAGRGRLVQLVLMESACLAILAAALGGLFAWQAAPFVVSMIGSPDNPVRLSLPADWRVLGFSLALALGVTFLFGLTPALMASATTPASSLKGGSALPFQHRLMRTLIGAQAAFCFLVLFVASLLVATFGRLSDRPVGFLPDRLLILNAQAAPPQSVVHWNETAQYLGALPGVERVALAGWPLLSNNSWNGFVSINEAPPSDALVYFLSVSPGWADTMQMQFTEGRDLIATDTSPGAALVNESFKRQFFNGESPLGKSFAKGRDRYRIVGVVHDAPYRSIREPNVPVAYTPFHPIDANGAALPIGYGAIIVRTSAADPLTMVSVMRHEVSRVRPELRISSVGTQAQINQSQTARERLLAILAVFFATVAIVLAGIGLYGVLEYSVVQRRREIGVRVAIGASPGGIATLIIVEAFCMMFAGALVGLALGMASTRYLEALLYGVTATEASVLALPSVTLLVLAILGSIPPVIRARRIDLASILRPE